MGNPLVSIIVITYNSSEYVLDTLESAKIQTYQNIELIISDDGSIDNTIEICEAWISKNKSSFIATQIITVPKNTGISPNCNRGVKVSQGKWLKLIAGDDILFPECISTFIEYTKINDDKIFFSDVELFGTKINTHKKIIVRTWLDKSIMLFDKYSTAKEQYNHLQFENIICAPSVFINKEVLQKLDWFDEEIKLMDDYPLWIKATSQNYKITCLKECLVKYRINDASVQRSKYYKVTFELFLQKYIYKNILFKIFLPLINQLRVNRKDLLFLNILKFCSLHYRFYYICKKKIRGF